MRLRWMGRVIGPTDACEYISRLSKRTPNESVAFEDPQRARDLSRHGEAQWDARNSLRPLWIQPSGNMGCDRNVARSADRRSCFAIAERV